MLLYKSLNIFYGVCFKVIHFVFQKLYQLHSLYYSHYPQFILVLPSPMPWPHKQSPSMMLSNLNFVSIFSLPMHATCPTHLILNFISLTLFSEEYKLCSMLLINFPYSPVTSPLLCPDIYLSTILKKPISTFPSRV
jgi:hypothetical protein